MLKRFLSAFWLLIVCVSLCYAQESWMPDPNLRQAVRAKLGLPADANFTRADLLRLNRLDPYEMGVQDLTGIEHATNLTWFSFAENDVSDLSPLATLTFSLVLIPPKDALQTFAHELAHALDWEMERLSPGFQDRVRAAYDNAKAEGLWPPSVIRGIWYEYWAEGVEIWFYEIGAGRMFETRAEFMAHDPLLGGILSEWFPAVSLRNISR